MCSRRVLGCLYFASSRRSKVIIFLLLWLLCFQLFFLFSPYGHPVRSKLETYRRVSLSRSIRTKSPDVMPGENPRSYAFVKPNASTSLEEIHPSDFFVTHSNSDQKRIELPSNIKYVLVMPHALTRKQEKLGLTFLPTNDLESVLQLGRFLQVMPEVDGASCLASSFKEEAHNLYYRNPRDTHKFQGLFNQTWCRFSRRDWSIQIRNTGAVHIVDLGSLFSSPRNQTATPLNMPSIFQLCNIISGAFVIRKDHFMQIKHWRPRFGRLGILDFFIHSAGNFRMTKVGNCFLSDSSHRVDRDEKQGVADFPDYASFGSEHGVLRIIQEDRIEWSLCIAKGHSCKEEPYTPPTSLPNIALPICCNVVLGRMLKDFENAATELGIRHRIIYGTLLGAVRNNAIIPWTHDIDVALPKNDYINATIYSELQRHLQGRYYVGKSFMNMPRMIPLFPAYIEVNTAEFYNDMHDTQGDRFFTDEIKDSVKGLFPINNYWRERGYLDFYAAPSIWWNGSSTVTINGDQYITIRDIDFELKNWYGKDYMKPVY